MVRNNGTMKSLGVAALVIAVCSLTLGYAALTQTLNINVGGTVQSGQTTWNIHFESNGKAATKVGNAVLGTMDLKQTTITLSGVTLKTAGDSVTYSFNVVNDGQLDAMISVLTPTEVTVTGGTTTEQNALKQAVEYTLKYADGSVVALNNSLLASEEKEMLLTISLKAGATLPSSNVSISNIGYTITYTQKTNSGGSDTPALAYTSGRPVYFNPKTGEECSEEDATLGAGTNDTCMLWYTILEEKNDNTVDLILAHNTTAMVPWNTDAPTTIADAQTQLLTDATNWDASVKATARLITAPEIAQIVGKTNYTYGSTYETEEALMSDLIWFEDVTYSDWSNMPSFPAQGQAKYAWLFDYTGMAGDENLDCTLYGCSVAADEAHVTFGYWTSNMFTIQGSSGAWGVSSSTSACAQLSLSQNLSSNRDIGLA